MKARVVGRVLVGATLLYYAFLLVLCIGVCAGCFECIRSVRHFAPSTPPQPPQPPTMSYFDVVVWLIRVVAKAMYPFLFD